MVTSQTRKGETDVEKATPSVESFPSQYMLTGNEYVDGPIDESGLHLVQDREVTQAYKERGALGLFSLFFTRAFRDAFLCFTNTILTEKGKPKATVFELDAYIGMKIAMSIIPLTEIKELRSQKLFLGQSDFIQTMARNRFKSIRARFQVHIPGSVHVQRREQDPLWHSHGLMTQIQEKFAAVVVPVGALSLDENTVRINARSGAKTFMSSKPDKYGVRFYAVVGWKSLYAYFIWDNGSGNRTRTVPAERYVDAFPALRSPRFRTLKRDDIPMQRNNASAVWVAMYGHLTKMSPARTSRRLVRDENVRYRKNIISRRVGRTFVRSCKGMNGQCCTRLLGTDGDHQCANLMGKKARRTQLPEHIRTAYLSPISIADNAGYVVVCDNLTVTFYTNDLAGTQLSVFSVVMVPRQFGCVMGLRHFAGGREKRFCTGRPFSSNKRIRVTQADRRFSSYASDITGVQERSRMEKGRRREPASTQTINEVVGVESSFHALTPNTKKHPTGKLTCYFCSLREFTKKPYLAARAATEASMSRRRDDILLSKRAVGSGLCVGSGIRRQTRLKKNKRIKYLDQLELP
ncbi:hypothetical protein PHMEG_00011776 [Phytophthora megakarya]|uniref:PiggyBac transposable element-derived protein domain-containing protein n=1 Tax=Phytophthora megakarya TaxID=4795 RepID=A0A225WAR3_9STRA|nr:hypothetical protein PHMEG_00011776 [Phytophthora megakarya]